MNKRLVYIIVGLLLLTIVVIGTTYAYFSFIASSNTPITTNSKKFEVIYIGGEGYEGPLQMVANKEGGHNETVKIKVAEGSVNAKLNLVLTIDEMSPAMSIPGFKWEVYGYKNGTQVYSKQGNFYGKSTQSGNNTIILVNNDYMVTEEETSFVVYWWLDGNMIDADLGGSNFRCHINAQTETITGVVKN